MMEKKGLRKKDMLRMDGLLPPTRRLPVCDAVSGTVSDKKKDRKWSIGGILRRISSIRGYDSSSNDEEIVYCKRTPRKPAKLNRQADGSGVVLHSIEDNPERRDGGRARAESSARHSAGSPSQLRRDSLHSRGSDASLDGSGKKIRKNKLKARAEAKRDHLRADSSSDEDCRRSNGSLNRLHAADGAHNGQRGGNVCSRKTRAARTERYIKRLSRDDGNGSGDTSYEPSNKRCSTAEDEQQQQQQQQRVVYADMNGSCRPPLHPRRAIDVAPPQNNRAPPPQRSSVESLRIDADLDVGLPDPEVASFNDCGRYSGAQYVTDMNQNNTYAKISRNIGTEVYAGGRQGGNFFTYPAKNVGYYPEPFDRAAEHRLLGQDSRPPEPPPRDPRYRVLGHGYNSYPTNRHQNAAWGCYEPRYGEEAAANGLSRPDWRYFRSYGSNNEIARQCEPVLQLEYPAKSSRRMEVCNSQLERVNNNNKYNSSRHHANDEHRDRETELTRCRRRNIRNEQLSRNDANSSARGFTRDQSANIHESAKRETVPPYVSAMWADWLSRRSPCGRITPTRDVDVNDVERSHEAGGKGATPGEEASERRRSSKNLEEALCELEAIYNSLRLGDEDLLDRAERRSMEELSLKRGRSELLDAMAVTDSPDSPDRTKDDMAYRRMHPKERPTSLSDIAGQSTLSSMSYLVASPVLSRKDPEEELRGTRATSGRRDEPDVTRDDMVYRSMNHANSSPKVIDPQPPFGIPLGPVSGATESDYLHTTPTRAEQPRSPYIPQCEPDVVTDDLAYRALRKDAGAARSGAATSARKKRAVRSLSANLYGLIDHDRIHLRREPSLDDIKDEIQDAAGNSAATSARAACLRRVVSDGELSDNDRRKEAAGGGGTDINGNHPTVGAYRKKLSRVYMSPEISTITTTRESPEKEASIAEISDAVLTSKAALDDEFWQEYLRPDSNVSNANSGHSTEADLSAYSRLCQELVNLIQGDDEPADQLSTGSSSSDNHCSGHCQRAVRTENVTSPAAFSTNSTEPETTSESTGNLDFHLRVADENVKLIAAAFGSVADNLRDSRLSVRNNSSTTSRDVSELENQSGSTRSSTLYSPDDAHDERFRSTAVVVVVSPRPEEARATLKRDSWTSNEGDQVVNSGCLEQDVFAATELDLSRAVRDLQLAAASLYEHGREIEDLGVVRDKKIDVDDAEATIVPISTNEREKDSPIRKINLIADALKKEQEEEEEKEEEEARVRGTDENEDESLLRKMIADDDLRQERERDQEEVTVLPSGIAETRRDAREESCEGERTVCELDRKLSRCAEDARSCVTNIITRATVTTYSILLLACLLALLLAIIAAS